MKEAYRKASLVICWLGPVNEDSDLVMDTLKKTGDAIMPIPVTQDVKA